MISLPLQLGELLSLLLGTFHCLFPQIFDWEQEFTRLSPRAARVLYTIHLFLIPFFFFFAYAAFWLFRGLWLLTFLRPTVQPRIAKFVLLHRVPTVVFFVMGVAFALPLANRYFRS
jgi:hypothetical protein